MHVECQCFQVCRQKHLQEAFESAVKYTHANMLTLKAVEKKGGEQHAISVHVNQRIEGSWAFCVSDSII